MTRVPIAEGLFVEDGGEVRLVASTSSTSEFLIFPAESGKDTVVLSNAGTLYTWTTQEFRPPSPPYIGPADFESFGVGYVEFPEGILVEGRLTTHDPARLVIGQPMRTVAIDFGEESVTFAFAPADEEPSA